MAGGSVISGVRSVILLSSVAAVGAVIYVNWDRDQIVKKVQTAAVLAKAKMKSASETITSEAPINATPSEETKSELKAAGSSKPEAAKSEPAEPIDQPKFDVLRVEKDGSVLVAGQSKPNETVELKLEDGTVVGSGKAGPSGDFVILPDRPLKPGDHVIGLQSKDADGSVTTSAQTGIVKIPEQGNDVLALISEEGKASRIVAKPEPVEIAEAKPVAKPVEAEVSEPAPPPLTAKTESGAAPAAKEAGQAKAVEMAKLETVPAAVETDSATADPQTVVEPLETAKDRQSTNKKSEPGVQAVQPTVEQPAIQADAPTTSKEPVSLPEATSSAPKNAKPNVVVEAVEVEADKVFVAGEAPRDVLVRVYIDNDPLGLTKGTPDNRFLVSKTYDLKPGKHAVRADVIDRKTGGVVSRAEVPLVHDVPTAETAKAPSVEVASAEPVPAAKLAPEPQPTLKSDEESSSKSTPSADNAAPAAGEKSPPISTPAPESEPEEEVVTAPSPPVAGDEPGSDMTVTNTDPVEKSEPVADTSEPSDRPDSKPTKLALLPKQTVSEDKQPADQQAPPDASKVANAVVPQGESTDSFLGSAPEIAPEQVTPKAQNSSTGDSEPASQPVIKTGTAVIIKYGDNLWRISRRTYGRGIRYTTIYNANRDQIRDPNRIYVGQIFKIPLKSDSE